MALRGPDSTMPLFEDLLHTANGDAICFDALLRGCSAEVYENLKVRRVLSLLADSSTGLLSRLEFTGSHASALEVRYWRLANQRPDVDP